MEIIASVRYDRIERIGAAAGKHSRVYRAFDHHLHAELAVKEVEKKLIGDPARFFQEARAVHASAHPRVVPIHWAADTPDYVCLAMPLMRGGSLADLIQAKPLRPARLIQVAQDLCEGVAQVHIAGYLHLDIKPSNVLFDSHGRAGISDFGLALKLDAYGTADARDNLIYPSFTPPEMVRHKAQVTPAADVYQIALSLYRAVNGEPYFSEQWKAVRAKPWPAANEAIENGEFPNRSFLPYVPLGIRRAILRGLDTDPHRRPVGARKLAEELATVVVKHDWESEEYEPDAGTWRLRQDGRADILVLRQGALPNARVQIWTETSAGRRRKRPDAWSKNRRTERQVRIALARAFRAAVM